MLWTAIHLSELPLEVITQQDTLPASGVAVTAVDSRQHLIYRCNTPAAECGVTPGMAVNAALALAPTLSLQPRQLELEQQAMQRLSYWAYQYSDMISMPQAHLILLEISKSEQLFSSINNLLSSIHDDLHEFGFTTTVATAPTPGAARLMAASGVDIFLRSLGALSQQLQRTSLQSAQLPPQTIKALNHIGVDNFGQLMALPRAEIIRRHGQETINYLDRLYGKTADPVPALHPPTRFELTLQLPAEVHTVEALLFAAGRLVRELCDFLVTQDKGIQQFRLTLHCQSGHNIPIQCHTVAPERDYTKFMDIVKNNLQHIELKDNVRAISLECEKHLDYLPETYDLFDMRSSETQWSSLFERLLARLGSEKIRFLKQYPDHRPEKAWQYTSRPTVSEVAESTREKSRPLWLLPAPKPLTGLDNLHFLGGPERLENGWWDGEDIRRDYYIVQTATGQRLWIFQHLRQPMEWFVHGLFG